MLQFNRGKLTVEARAEVLAFFQCTFEGWYGEFYNRAECYYAETPLDVLGARFQDYPFLDTAARVSSPKYVPAGTLYLGAKTSNRAWTIYDKAKQLAETSGVKLSSDLLRIEPALKLAIPANKLHELDRRTANSESSTGRSCVQSKKTFLFRCSGEESSTKG